MNSIISITSKSPTIQSQNVRALQRIRDVELLKFTNLYPPGELCFQFTLGHFVWQDALPDFLYIGSFGNGSIFHNASTGEYVSSRFCELNDEADIDEILGCSFSDIVETRRKIMITDWGFPAAVPPVYISEQIRSETLLIFDISKEKFLTDANMRYCKNWSNKNGGIWFDEETSTLMVCVFQRGREFNNLGIQLRFYLGGTSLIFDKTSDFFSEFKFPKRL